MKSFHVKSKWVIGFTGSMLSGKSTALAYFAKCGAATFSCDEIARELYQKPQIVKKIERMFGTADKAKIAALIFKNNAKRQALENLLHPLIFGELQTRIAQCSRRVIVIEIPLLFEKGWDQFTDLNIAVLADPKTLPQRLRGRNLTQQEYTRRVQYQLKDEEKAARADVVFFHTNKAQLKKSVERFCHVFEVLQSK